MSPSSGRTSSTAFVKLLRNDSTLSGYVVTVSDDPKGTTSFAVDRTGRGLLVLTGPQRVWFLQQTITADVEDVPSGQWRESAFLTPKGKIVSHFYVGLLGDEVFIDVDPPAADLADWLSRYRFRTKVDIEDRSGSVLTVAGPVASDLAEEGQIRRHGDAVAFGHRLGALSVADVHGELGSLDVIDRVGEEVLERARIEAGIPRFGIDYTTDHLPQEAGLTRIASVDKGCYVGQETVARIHFRGHVNRVTRPVTLSGVSASDALGADVILDDTKIGTITSASGTSAIGMLRVEPAAGTHARLSSGGVAVVGAVPEGTKVKPGG